MLSKKSMINTISIVLIINNSLMIFSAEKSTEPIPINSSISTSMRLQLCRTVIAAITKTTQPLLIRNSSGESKTYFVFWEPSVVDSSDESTYDAIHKFKERRNARKNTNPYQQHYLNNLDALKYPYLLPAETISESLLDAIRSHVTLWSMHSSYNTLTEYDVPTQIAALENKKIAFQTLTALAKQLPSSQQPKAVDELKTIQELRKILNEHSYNAKYLHTKKQYNELITNDMRTQNSRFTWSERGNRRKRIRNYPESKERPL